MASTDKRTLKAYSILEVVIALIILLLLFFIAIEFFVTVNNAGFNIQKKNAEDALYEYIATTKEARSLHSETAEINGWKIGCEIAPYKELDSLVQITYTVFKKGTANDTLIKKMILMDLHKL